MFYFFLLTAIWFIRAVKAILFWLYLWQLKNYHIGRFLDHFRTAKGRQIFLNWLVGTKIVLLAGSFTYVPFLWPAAVILYCFETTKTLFDFYRRAAKKPVFTAKVFLLAFLAFGLMGFLSVAPLIFFSFGRHIGLLISWLLALDVFTSLFVSAIVLAFQPFAVLGRRRIIENAKKKRASFSNLTVIGITGSYGKTSTKDFLALVLSEKFKVCKTKAHQNSEVGVAQCILNDLNQDHEVFIVEMGAYGKGGIKLLCDIARPKIGILTGINEQHMATFGSQENIIKTKFELIEALPEDGTAIVNWDNENIKIGSEKRKAKKYSLKIKTIKYSALQKEDIWAEDISVEKEHVSFRVVARDSSAGSLRSDCSADFRINVLGAHYVPNILAVAACAKELGMTMAEITDACRKIMPELAGMTLKGGVNGMMVIGATYSANPDGVISHLDYLKVFPGKKNIVMPCLIELGKASKEAHQRIGRKTGEVCDLAIIVTKERFNDIKNGAVEKGMKEENVLFLEKPMEILEKIRQLSGPEDVVLLEGRLQKSLIEMIGK